MNRFRLSNIFIKSSVCNDFRKLYMLWPISRSMFMASVFSSISFSKTSRSGRDSHSSSSDNFAMRSPSVVNPPFSFLSLITFSFLPFSSSAFMAKNGTASSSLLSSSSSSRRPASACSFASIFARETASAALARSSCFAISSFTSVDFEPIPHDTVEEYFVILAVWVCCCTKEETGESNKCDIARISARQNLPHEIVGDLSAIMIVKEDIISNLEEKNVGCCLGDLR
mmetsp:Transcript_9729/g.24247  ORF Transcript_9729/g.24247 Transcript_9729/m.24247 type:complete len:227 (-) Transcript_9729:166-846(-)